MCTKRWIGLSKQTSNSGHQKLGSRTFNKIWFHYHIDCKIYISVTLKFVKVHRFHYFGTKTGCSMGMVMGPGTMSYQGTE